jgi:hypothetical protein
MRNILVVMALFIVGFTSAQQNNKMEKEYSTCEYMKNPAGSLNKIKESAKILIGEAQNEGSCIYSLIDTLKDKFIATSNVEYIICLDSICNVSDGAIGEYVESIDEDLFFTTL